MDKRNDNNIDTCALNKCIKILQELFGDVETITLWLEDPHPLLEFKKPSEALMDGQAHQVMTVLIFTRAFLKITHMHK